MPNGDRPPEVWEAADHIENLKPVSRDIEDKEHAALAGALIWVIRHMDLSEKKKPILSIGSVSAYSFTGIIGLMVVVLFLDKLGLSVFVQ